METWESRDLLANPDHHPTWRIYAEEMPRIECVVRTGLMWFSRSLSHNLFIQQSPMTMTGTTVSTSQKINLLGAGLCPVVSACLARVRHWLWSSAPRINK